MTATENTATVTSVIAEEAPIGVCLWPVRDEKYAPNFTLAAVEVVRTSSGTRVTWRYEGGNVRSFFLGERVTVRY